MLEHSGVGVADDLDVILEPQFGVVVELRVVNPHKDLMERLKKGRCTPEQIDLYCAEGKDLEDCLDRCE